MKKRVFSLFLSLTLFPFGNASAQVSVSVPASVPASVSASVDAAMMAVGAGGELGFSNSASKNAVGVPIQISALSEIAQKQMGIECKAGIVSPRCPASKKEIPKTSLLSVATVGKISGVKTSILKGAGSGTPAKGEERRIIASAKIVGSHWAEALRNALEKEYLVESGEPEGQVILGELDRALEDAAAQRLANGQSYSQEEVDLRYEQNVRAAIREARERLAEERLARLGAGIREELTDEVQPASPSGAEEARVHRYTRHSSTTVYGQDTATQSDDREVIRTEIQGLDEDSVVVLGELREEERSSSGALTIRITLSRRVDGEWRVVSQRVYAGDEWYSAPPLIDEDFEYPEAAVTAIGPAVEPPAPFPVKARTELNRIIEIDRTFREAEQASTEAETQSVLSSEALVDAIRNFLRSLYRGGMRTIPYRDESVTIITFTDAGSTIFQGVEHDTLSRFARSLLRVFNEAELNQRPELQSASRDEMATIRESRTRLSDARSHLENALENIETTDRVRRRARRDRQALLMRMGRRRYVIPVETEEQKEAVLRHARANGVDAEDILRALEQACDQAISHRAQREKSGK